MLLLLFAICTLQPFVRAAPHTITGQWALADFQHACAHGGGYCTFAFSILEKPSVSRQSVQCRFALPSVNGALAARSNFSDAQCMDASQYHINGGWDQKGSIVITVNNIQEKQNAWFGYEGKEIANGQVVAWKESPSYEMSTSSKRSHTLGGLDKSSLNVREDNVTWALRNVHRRVEDSVVIVDLDIDDGSGTLHNCHLQVAVAPGVNARTISWVDKRCKHSGWYLSWGYNRERDSTTPTLVNPERNRNAWFGWDYINNAEDLPDVGPNPAEPCNCGTPANIRS